MKDRTRRVSIWGAKQPMREPASVLQEAEECLALLNSYHPKPLDSVPAIRDSFVDFGRSYYSLAALSRRKVLDVDLRVAAMARLFALRSLLEKQMLAGLKCSVPYTNVLGYALRSGFFGKSIKQGVSIRFPLATCVPTTLCGGRCYAHDGRDRDLQRVFRGVLNWYVADFFENGDTMTRCAVMEALSKSIDDAIAAARAECRSVASEGYSRRPRIRFSHVGEMASTPTFTLALAKEVRRRAPDIACVIYTRHPLAKLLVGDELIVNFTVDGTADSRMRLRPRGARLVSSSWDGKLVEEAEINFLEHHVEKSATPSGQGQCCPVTLNHHVNPSCDSARCEKCFVPLSKSPSAQPADHTLLGRYRG
jgi:hypothetical protein